MVEPGGKVKFWVDWVDSKVYALFKMHQLSDVHNKCMLLLCKAKNFLEYNIIHAEILRTL